jgi:hypothetical protein
MKCPSLSFLTNLGFKSALLDLGMAALESYKNNLDFSKECWFEAISSSNPESHLNSDSGFDLKF